MSEPSVTRKLCRLPVRQFFNSPAAFDTLAWDITEAADELAYAMRGYCAPAVSYIVGVAVSEPEPAPHDFEVVTGYEWFAEWPGRHPEF